MAPCKAPSPGWPRRRLREGFERKPGQKSVGYSPGLLESFPARDHKSVHTLRTIVRALLEHPRVRSDLFEPFGISESRNLGISESRNLAISESRNLGISESRNLGISEFQNCGISEFRNLNISQFRNLGISEFRNCSEIVMVKRSLFQVFSQMHP